MYVRQFQSDPRAREKPCLRCGLSLRKHLDEKFCPQCGLSVWLSLNPNDSLDWSRPAWLRRSARGAWLLAAAQPLALVAYLLAVSGSMLVEVAHPYSDVAIETGMSDEVFQRAATQPGGLEALEAAAYAPPEPSVVVAIAALLAGVYLLASAAGLVLLTINEERYPDRVKSVRIGSRVAASASALVGLALLTLTVPRLASGWPTHTVGSSLLLFATEVAFAASAFCAWLWLRRVAQRAGKSFLSKLCGYLLFLPVLPFVKAAPLFGIWFLWLLSPVVYLLPLAYLPLSVYLFVRFALLLQRAAPDAEHHWAKESRPPAAAVPVAAAPASAT